MFDLKSIFDEINRHLEGKRNITSTASTAIRQKLNEFIGFHLNIIE